MKENTGYFLTALGMSLLQPFLMLGAVYLGESLFIYDLAWLLLLTPSVLCGVALARLTRLPASPLRRYLPPLIPVYILIAAAPFFCLFSGISMRGMGFAIVTLALAAVYGLFLLSFLVSSLVALKRLKARQRRENLRAGALSGGGRFRPALSALLRLGLLLAVSCGICAAGMWLLDRDIMPPARQREATVGHGIDVREYLPFSPGNRLAVPAAPPSLRIGRGHPRLDGAIAMLPVYAAAAQAVYQELEANAAAQAVRCTNTPEAYRRLADDETDVFFGLGPSSEQRAYIENKGLALELLPIGREAFVFFVHRENPVDNLSLEQIRAIYSRQVTNWRQLADVSGPGGAEARKNLPDARILAFQRPDGSGSQTAMLSMVMHGRTMMPPLREERSTGMGDIVLRTAEYRNRLNALGYSFRWYATVQFAHPDVKLLAVDGVYPNEENIRNGSYPLTANFFAVTVRPQSSSTSDFLGWLTGPEGQDLITRTGYVGLGSASRP